MSLLRNAANAIVPIRESRRKTATLAINGAENVLDVDGDENAILHLLSNDLVGTIEFSASYDDTGASFHLIPAFPVPSATSGGAVPVGGRPLTAEALTAANDVRSFAVPCGQYRRIRVRLTSYTGGNAVTTWTSDSCASAQLFLTSKPMTELITATAAAGAAVTATLPAVAGLRHVVDFIRIKRFAAVALTAAATPVLTSSTNLPGSHACSIAADAAVQGTATEEREDFGGTGLAAVAAGTATTVVCPATPNVIWRVTVGYRLGL